MAQVKKIELAFACQEDWNKMTPVEKGRHCAACQKTVVNFMAMSDEQVVAFYSDKSVANTCGNFRVGQLEHINKILRQPDPRNKKYSFVKPVLAATLLSTAACNSKPSKTQNSTQKETVTKTIVEKDKEENESALHSENKEEKIVEKSVKKAITVKKRSAKLDSLDLDLGVHYVVEREPRERYYEEYRTAGVPLVEYEVSEEKFFKKPFPHFTKQNKVWNFFKNLFKRKVKEQ